MNMQELVQEVSIAIEGATWSAPDTNEDGIVAYFGKSSGWNLLVANYEGRVDGTATDASRMLVVRMTQEQAKDAMKRART